MGKITKLFVATAYSVILPFIRKKPYRIVLYYHDVREEDIEAFEKQMSYLAGRCKVVKLSEILAAEADDCNAIVAITFDDAFVSVLKNGLPVLKRHGLTASIFVPTGNLGQPPKWDIPEDSLDRNELVMSKEQLAEIDKDGFEVLSHTVSHCVLTEQNDRRLKRELSESKIALENIIGHEVCGISYPHGAYDSEVCRAAKQVGYLSGYTIEPCIVDSHTDSMQIGRVFVSPMDSLFEFKLKVSGSYQVVSYLRTVKKNLFRRFD
jgi:peptidoglycan/xylan/chitin deacetylase (PgdA/CDA1 family)